MSPISKTMLAVVTTGVGGYEKLDYREIPVPCPGRGEVLLRVLAAGVNNTEINTRLGWYSETVRTGTADVGEVTAGRDDGGWNEATPFPFVQGTDCCGEVVEVGPGGDTALLGRRALVRSCMRPKGFASPDNVWMGSDFDGAFAQFVKVPQTEVFPIDCAWSDAELATIPCAYGTAENMLQRVGLEAGESVLISGASGGVGSAALQLAKLRGARVIAIASAAKREAIQALGADAVFAREADLVAELGGEAVDVVVDNVVGAGFASMLELLRRGGRYVSSGAIAGPIVEFDIRKAYLKDIAIFGCTAWDEPVFPDLIGYIEQGRVRPLLAKTFALAQIAEAQAEFATKNHIGKFVLVPPEPSI